MTVTEAIRPAARRLASALRRRSRLVGLGAAAGAAAGAAVVARRQRREGPSLPDPTTGALETATALHNAAKGTMISAIRTAEAPTVEVVGATVRTAMADAAESGADLTPVAIGVAAGAAEVAHLLDLTPEEAAVDAATAATEAAERQGVTAASRVRAVFAGLPLG